MSQSERRKKTSKDKINIRILHSSIFHYGKSVLQINTFILLFCVTEWRAYHKELVKNTVWQINCSCLTTYDCVLSMYFMLQNQRFITTHYLRYVGAITVIILNFKHILFIFLYTFVFPNSIVSYFLLFFSWILFQFSKLIIFINYSTLFWYFCFSIITNVFPLSAFTVKYRFSLNFFAIDFIVLNYWFFYYYIIPFWYFGFVFVAFICTLVL